MVTRFLEDSNETVRFHAVGALLAQAEASRVPCTAPILLPAEQSVRVRNRILDGFAAAGWDVGDKVDEIKSRLPPATRSTARAFRAERSGRSVGAGGTRAALVRQGGATLRSRA